MLPKSDKHLYELSAHCRLLAHQPLVPNHFLDLWTSNGNFTVTNSYHFINERIPIL